MISVSISRESLSLPDLVITDNPYAGDYHLDERGNEYPRFPVLRTYAPDSEFQAGRVVLSSRLDEGTMSLRVYAHGDDAASVKAARDALDAATGQWEYTVTLTINGAVEGAWVARPEVANWGEIQPGMVKAHMAVGALTIPLQPGNVYEETP